MANKAIINLSPGVNVNDFKNGDVLIYDFEKKEFYTINQAVFFDKYNEQIKELKDEFAKEKAANREFTLKIQESNQKLIEMVENFIKGEKEKC